jgi:putative ABC transport system substrate-binding protein
MMRRRDFFRVIAGSTIAWSLAARAQQAGRVPTIGFLGLASASGWSRWTAAFVQRLSEVGWIVGRNLAIEYRWLEGHPERLPAFLADFAKLKVDIVVTGGGEAVSAAKRAMPVTPIVFAVATDAVADGLVASLARPGGYVTGLTLMAPDLVGKRLELLREMIPDLRQLAIMANVRFPDALVELRAATNTAKALGLETTTLEIRMSEDIAPAIDQHGSGAQAIYVVTDPVLFLNRLRLADVARGARLPTMSGIVDYVEAGGLVSYGPDISNMFRSAGDYVDKILRGAKPADLPVEQPTKFDLVINLTTARALGLKIPEAFLLRADKVIE